MCTTSTSMWSEGWLVMPRWCWKICLLGAAVAYTTSVPLAAMSGFKSTSTSYNVLFHTFLSAWTTTGEIAGSLSLILHVMPVAGVHVESF